MDSSRRAMAVAVADEASDGAGSALSASSRGRGHRRHRPHHRQRRRDRSRSSSASSASSSSSPSRRRLDKRRSRDDTEIPSRRRHKKDKKDKKAKRRRRDKEERRDRPGPRRRRDDRSHGGRRHRRHKEEHTTASHSSHSSDSSSNSDEDRGHRTGGAKAKRARAPDDDELVAPLPDLKGALSVVRELLSTFPSIAPDLLGLLQMLDDGETAVLGGIANAQVKGLLAKLFPLLGLSRLREPPDAFAARGKLARGSSLLETVAAMLGAVTDRGEAPSSTDAATAETPRGPEEGPPSRRRTMPIGPAMPPSHFKTTDTADGATVNALDDDDDDDDIVGPALPGERGFRLADAQVEAEMAQRAKELEEEEWRRARGEVGGSSSASQAPTQLVREDWMTQMPENDRIFQDAMGPKRNSGKPAAFRSKEPAAIDRTWFDTPEERERAKRAKLDMELLGYVREENAPRHRPATQPGQMPQQGPTVNESILPAANPEADKDMRRQMDLLKQNRGPSLLEQHQQKMADQAKQSKDSEQSRTTWDRDRDLVIRKTLSKDEAAKIINSSKQISSKFTAPTVTRQFL